MKYQVRDESPFSHYSMLPNLIDDLGLSPYAFRLYGHLKRVTGEGGSCWQNTRTLAEACKMSAGMVSKAKKELMSTKPPLIAVALTNHPKGGFDYHEIAILDIWQENKQKYGSLYEQPVHHMNNARSPHEQPRSQSEPKNTPIKKTPIKKKTSNDVPTQQQVMVGELAKVTGFDLHLHGGRLGRSASKLVKAGYLPETVERAYCKEGWWYKNDWRGLKGEMPTPEQIVETIGRIELQGRVNGHTPNPARKIILPDGQIVDA